MKTILIKTDVLVKEGQLAENETATAIWEALPLQGRVNRWGDEIYFDIPVQIPLAAEARADMRVGDLAYWPPGQAFCIFWGPTPASIDGQPRAASPVNVFGSVSDGPLDFGDVRDGTAITIGRREH